MRQNFRRDKIKKEEMRKKKQEEKRNKRLHKKDASAPDSGGMGNLAESINSSAAVGQTNS